MKAQLLPRKVFAKRVLVFVFARRPPTADDEATSGPMKAQLLPRKVLAKRVLVSVFARRPPKADDEAIYDYVLEPQSIRLSLEVLPNFA